MGRQEVLFYRFRIKDHGPAAHLLRRIDWLLDFGAIRHELEAFYSHIGRPSVDPEAVSVAMSKPAAEQAGLRLQEC